MRFGSYKDFTRFLKGLSDIGYQVPFTDYELEMSKRGFKKHIHYYECDINKSNTSFVLTFVDTITTKETTFTFERNKKNG